MSTQDTIAKYITALTTIAEKLRSKSPDANQAANLAISALNAASQWLTEAATINRANPFELNNKDDTEAAA
jgi:hypothetical protein